MADPLTTLGAIGIANAINGTDAPGVPAETYSSTTLPDAIVREAQEGEDAKYRPNISLVAGGSLENSYIVGELGARINLSPKIGITGTLIFGGEKDSSTTYTTVPSPLTGVYGEITESKINSIRIGAGGYLNLGSEKLYMSVGGNIFYDMWKEKTTINVFKGGTVLDSIESSIPGKNLSGKIYMGAGSTFGSRFGLEAGLIVDLQKNEPSFRAKASYQITPKNRNRE